IAVRLVERLIEQTQEKDGGPHQLDRAAAAIGMGRVDPPERRQRKDTDEDPSSNEGTDQGSPVTVAPDPPADQAHERYHERRAASVNQDAEPERGSGQRPGPDASAVRQV